MDELFRMNSVRPPNTTTTVGIPLDYMAALCPVPGPTACSIGFAVCG